MEIQARPGLGVVLVAPWQLCSKHWWALVTVAWFATGDSFVLTEPHRPKRFGSSLTWRWENNDV